MQRLNSTSEQHLITPSRNQRTLFFPFPISLFLSQLSRINMRSKTQSPINIKIAILCFFFLLLVFLIIWSTSLFDSQPNYAPPVSPETHAISESTFSQYGEPQSSMPEACPSLPLTPTCTKTPPSLSSALVHYATRNITPQQTLKEISVTLRVLEKKSPCNFLVFGLGHDSLMWASLNLGGRTIFLEEDKSWIDQIKEKLPTLESYHVTYDTKVYQAERLMETAGEGEECEKVSDPRFSKCPLSLKGFPADVYDTEWDLIMVDAPTGYHDEAPGRMTAIYTAGLMARNSKNGETDVFVHDVNRVVEDKFSMAFLCQGYLTEQEGRLRHFSVPSHRTRSGRPFCP